MCFENCRNISNFRMNLANINSSFTFLSVKVNVSSFAYPWFYLITRPVMLPRHPQHSESNSPVQLRSEQDIQCVLSIFDANQLTLYCLPLVVRGGGPLWWKLLNWSGICWRNLMICCGVFLSRVFKFKCSLNISCFIGLKWSFYSFNKNFLASFSDYFSHFWLTLSFTNLIKYFSWYWTIFPV